MAIPFSNTTQRIPPGFANLLEGLAREVLRNQPEDIPIFAAKYFETLLIEREKTGYDPSEWGAKLDDRYYNNRAFNELAPPGGGDKTEEKTEEPEEPAAQAEEAIQKPPAEGSSTSLTEEQAATKLQAMFRGYKTRKERKVPNEEPGAEEEAGKEAEKVEEPSEPDKKEPSEPDKKEPQ